MKILIDETRALSAFLNRHRRVVALTGAGISAGSGIPTYRDARGHWRGREPVKHHEFVSDPARRRRYWARSMAGWPAVRDARPNPAHIAMARLEHRDRLQLVITQNVDRLHQRAGSTKVVDLHGRLDRVRCLSCNALSPRDVLQHRLERLNRAHPEHRAVQLPDGDAETGDALERELQVPDCDHCGGFVMPDVVFFGGSVPAARVEQCKAAVHSADALLAVGTSLQVYSGFRFCRLAAELGKPIALVNQGITRADDLAELKLNSDCATLLSRVADEAGAS
jgi:NAD-dependent SIR2 family protein deacetylase